MGLGLRNLGAKRLGLAFAGLLLLSSPAYAACTTTDTTPMVTATGDPAVIGDQAYVVATPSTGLYFEDDIGSLADSIAIANDVAIDSTGTLNPGIEIYGEFDVICYDGSASASIVSDDAGISVEQLSDGDVLLNIAHSITAGDIGVVVSHDGDGLVDIDAGTIDGLFSGIAVVRSGDGDTTIDANGSIASTAGAGIVVQEMGSGTVTVTANGTINAAVGGILAARSSSAGDTHITVNADIDGGAGPAVYAIVDPFSTGNLDIRTNADLASDDSGIAVVHWGDDGDVEITTAVGTTISAHGGGGPPLWALPITGSVGIYVDRSGTVNSDITITNGADIDVDAVGMYIDVCACIDANLLVSSSGTIDVDTGFGIYVSKGATGSTTVNQSGKVRVQDGAGLAIDQYEDGDVVASLTGGVEANLGGLIVQHAADGDVTATAGGTFAITNGNGVEVYLGGTGDVRVQSTASLMASDIGIFAEHAGAGTVNVTIAGGTIAAPRGILALASAGTGITATIAAGTTITVTGAGAGRYGATFDGPSDVTVAGTIDATGTDALLFSGGDANLTLLPGFVIDGQVDALAAATNQLIFGGATGDGAFDLDRLGTDFTDFDTFTKTGNSTWTLSGSAFTGLLTANAGTVVINSAIPGLDLILDNATLKGNSTLNSLNTTGGSVAPGNSIGTIVVAGNATIGSNTLYDVEVNAAGASDKLVAGGTVTIAPTADVVATMEPGSYGALHTYTIVTGAAGVAGTFEGVTAGSAFYTPTLSYDLNNVYLTLTRNTLTLGDFANTPNQQATAAALDGAGLGAPYFDDLFVLPAGDVAGALDALSGDGYASLAVAALDDGHFVRDAALDRRGARGVWSTPYGGLAHLPGDGKGPAVDHATGGLLLGADGAVGDGYFGVLLGYGRSSYAIPARDMAASSGEFSLGSYAGAEWDQFYASFGAAITGRDIDATRSVVFPGVSDTFRAQYASLTAQAFGEIGYRLEMGGTTVTPFGGLAGLEMATTGYTETGSGAGALTVDASTTAALVTTLGLRVEHEIALNDETTLILRASAAWKHAMGKASISSTMSGTDAFTVAGAPLPADTLTVTAGAALDMGQLGLGLDYTGSFGGGGMSNAATATLAGQF